VSEWTAAGTAGVGHFNRSVTIPILLFIGTTLAINVLTGINGYTFRKAGMPGGIGNDGRMSYLYFTKNLPVVTSK